MKSLRIKRTAKAEEDLIAIWCYIAADNEAAADRLLDRLNRRWELLSTQPHSGMSRSDIGDGIRYVVVGEYLTFYRVDAGDIAILRVMHGRRDIGSDDVFG